MKHRHLTSRLRVDRRRVRTRPAATVLILATLATACGHHAAGADGTTRTHLASGRPGADAVVTVKQADGAAAAYDRLNADASRRLDPALLRRTETGAALRIDLAAYRILSGLHRRAPGVTPTRRRYYLPAVAVHTAPWFTSIGTEPGTQGLTDYQIFAWEQGAWKVTRIGRGDQQDVPAIAIKTRGAALALDPAAQRLLPVPPQTATAVVAARLTGQQGPAGPHLLPSAALTALAAGLPGADAGIDVTATAELTLDPVYALRTVDGGALAFLVLAVRRVITAVAPGRQLTLAGTAASAFVGDKPRARVTEHRLVSLVVHLDGHSPTVRVVGSFQELVDAQ